MSFPSYLGRFLLREQLGDLFDNAILSMEDLGFESYMLSVRRAHHGRHWVSWPRFA